MHFLLGKSSRVVFSLALLLILVRVLPVEQYAAYISFTAVIIAVGVVTSLGIQQILFRYLPELRATNNHRSAYRLLFWGFIVRTLIVTAFFAVLLPLTPWLAKLFQFEAWTWLFPWYLLVGYIRLTALWISECLESFLWQKESQYSLAVANAATAILVIAFAAAGELNLQLVVAAELAGWTLGTVLLGYSWVRNWRSDEERSIGDTTWWRQNRRRAMRFGGWSFMLNQSRLLYGSAPNRLIAARFLSVEDVALLGAADNIVSLLRKNLPTRMLMGMIRPIAMARFAETGDYRQVAWISELVYRTNVMLLTLPIVILAIVGPELMSWVTGGKYAPAGYLLLGFLVVLITEGSRQIVELTVQALEKNPIFFWTNLIQSGSILLAVPLLPIFGLWSLVVANLVGTVAANSIVIARLSKEGHPIHIDLTLMTWILVHAAVAGLAGWLTWTYSHSLIVTILVTTAIYIALIALKPPLNDREKTVLTSLVGKRWRKKSSIATESIS